MAQVPPPQMSADSDPRSALRALIERGAGTSVAATMLRLLLLRQEHPDAVIATEALRVQDDVVVIRATIALPTGAAGSGISAEHVADPREWAAAVERTQTHAIARALDTLGDALEAATGRAPADGALPLQATREPVTAAAPDAMPQPEPEADRPAEPPPGRVTAPPAAHGAPAAPEAETPPVIDALRRANRRATSMAAPDPAASPAGAEDDAPLADYSWTAFWTRARELGLNKPAIEERIGRPIQGLSPLQLREALEQTGLDFRPSPEG